MAMLEMAQRDTSCLGSCDKLATPASSPATSSQTKRVVAHSKPRKAAAAGAQHDYCGLAAALYTTPLQRLPATHRQLSLKLPDTLTPTSSPASSWSPHAASPTPTSCAPALHPSQRAAAP